MKVNIEGDTSYEISIGKENKLQLKTIDPSNEDLKVVSSRIEKSSEPAGKNIQIPSGEYVNFELGNKQESMELCYIRGIIAAADTEASSFIFFDNGHYFKIEDGKLTNYLETSLEEGLEIDGLSTVYMLEGENDFDEIQGVHIMFIPKNQKLKFLLLGASKKDYILPFVSVKAKGSFAIVGDEQELKSAFSKGVIIFAILTIIGVVFSTLKAPLYKKGDAVAAQVKILTNSLNGEKPQDYTDTINNMGFFLSNTKKQDRMKVINGVINLMGKYQLEPTGINIGQDSVTISSRTQMLQNATNFLQVVQTEFPNSSSSSLTKEGGVYYGFSINVKY